MIVRDDQNSFFVKEWFRGQFGFAQRQVENRHRELAALKLRQQTCGRCIDNNQMNPRKLLFESAQQCGYEPAPRCSDDAEAHGAANVVAQRRHVGGNGLEFSLDAQRPQHDNLALGGEFTGAPVDEHSVELTLEARDVGRHVRLHGVKSARRGREASMF